MQAYALTDVGLYRTVNQDSVFWSEQSVGRLPNLFIVADGMGGHRGGDFASAFAVRRMTEILEESEDEEETDPVYWLTYAVHQVNVELFREASGSREYQGMGTTLVACTVFQGRLTAINVGDSRLYLCQDRLLQITRDHSLVEEMVEKGTLEKGSADYINHKNIITRAVGVNRTVEADVFQETLLPGQWILLCSDGLTTMVEDRQIESILREEQNISAAARRLVQQANDNGGRDNIAVILINPECDRE